MRSNKFSIKSLIHKTHFSLKITWKSLSFLTERRFKIQAWLHISICHRCLQIGPKQNNTRLGFTARSSKNSSQTIMRSPGMPGRSQMRRCSTSSSSRLLRRRSFPWATRSFRYLNYWSTLLDSWQSAIRQIIKRSCNLAVGELHQPQPSLR